MRNVTFFLLLGCAFLLNSCSKEADGTIFIRVNNESTKPVNDIVVFTETLDGYHDIETSYGSIPGQHATVYKRHQRGYAFPFLRFTMHGYPTFEIRDVCRVGLTEMEPGWYTILITDDSQPTVRLIKD